MTDRPTLVELRARVFKHSAGGPEVGNVLARRVGRPSAVYGTWAAVRLGVSAHQVTAAAIVAHLASAAAIGSGSRAGFVAGVGLAALAYWLDHVDGQVARWRGTAGLAGVYLDYVMHHLAALTLGFALGFGLAVRTGHLAWAAAGFLVGAGWLFLRLHDDCRYKALFQRLKRERGSFRVAGGSGGRPAPPAPWPRRGVGRLTWPAFKACEPHVVLAGLVALALLAVAAPAAWALAWRGAVLLMAAMAPTLAAARSARAVARDAAGAEFDRWFRPWPGA